MRAMLDSESPRDLPQTTLVPLDAPFLDPRGSIQNVLHRDIGSVVLITSVAGSTRAGHWHKEDWHFCYVVSGRISYFEREVGSQACPRHQVIRPGELFFTPPRMEHEMFFPIETVFLTLANLHRIPADYEADLVRLVPSLRAEFFNPAKKVS